MREAENEHDLVAIHRLLLQFGDECARCPVNAQKVLARIIEAYQDERTAILMALDGERLVGSLALYPTPFWYGDEEFLVDNWFYVIPNSRNADAGPALLHAARQIADATDLQLFINITNPTRRRGEHTGKQRISSVLGYVPAGAVLAFKAKEAPDVLRR